MDQVILVDTEDNEIGSMEKIEAHRKGALHRAFSVLLFNSAGDMLLQKRAKNKYHSAGLWSNACCSHPMPGENIKDAVSRRLQEELGIQLTPSFSHKFIYHIEFPNNLTEHELDHVYIGSFDGVPNVNKDEVEDWKFISQKELKGHMAKYPDQYTHWFKLILSDDFALKQN